jgi:multiple sugar transport system substrate-binding protein
VIAVVPLVLSAVTLTACGSGGGSSAGSSAGGKIEGDITFQTWNLKANFKDYFQGVVADFEKQNPGVKVKWVDQPAENYATKLSADAAGGTLPDVVNVTPDLSYPLAKAGVLVNLDKEPAAAKYKGDYTPEAWQGNELPGMSGSYSFPWYLNTGPLFFDRLRSLAPSGGVVTTGCPGRLDGRGGVDGVGQGGGGTDIRQASAAARRQRWGPG